MLNLEKKKSEDVREEKEQDEKVIENLKYPSLGKLQDLGVEYKPTINYKVHSLGFNILKIPQLDAIKPKVVSHRSAKKGSSIFDDKDSDKDKTNIFSPHIMVSNLPINDEDDSNLSEEETTPKISKPALKAKTDRSSKRESKVTTPRSNKNNQSPRWSAKTPREHFDP